MIRQQAIELVGLTNVEAAEADNCEETGRLYYHDDGEIEWRGSIKVDYSELTAEQVANLPIGGCYLHAYYYTDADDADTVDAYGGDWGAISWTVHHYSVE